MVGGGGEEPSRQALEMAAINGRVNFFAGAYPDTAFPFGTNLVHYKQMHVTGSHDFTPHNFSTALKLIAHGIVDVKRLISHRFELDGVKDAFETAAGRGGLEAIGLSGAR